MSKVIQIFNKCKILYPKKKLLFLTKKKTKLPCLQGLQDKIKIILGIFYNTKKK